MYVLSLYFIFLINVLPQIIAQATPNTAKPIWILTLFIRGTSIIYQDDQLGDLFALGAGHVNPLKADEPGLIYDIHSADYIGQIQPIIQRSLLRGVHVAMKPPKLHFTKVGQNVKYASTFIRTNKPILHHQFAQGYMLWVSPNHNITSPIVQFD
ncbi:unnamed protein product [Linum trigynum]|uniref:Subtilisin-like protease fibronectin type-III domain-containing protein n=1 Tax=Linum trigynum TaxID=586398 RepID=A0AAV2DNM3_9ROSI